MRCLFGRSVRRTVAAATLAATLCGVQAASAATIDGLLGVGEYGAPLAVQTIGTGFGDNFTELNAAFGQVNGSNLEILITGNVEANGNRLHLFLDTAAGGNSTLVAGSSFDSQQVAGTTLDIAPEFLISVHEQFGGFQVDFFHYPTDTNSTLVLSGNPGTGVATGSNGSTVAWTNANTAGVDGNQGAANANALTAVSGVEFSIPLVLIGSPVGDIRATAAGAGTTGFFSNQFLGALPVGTNNLGFDPNLANIAGDQFFTIPNAPVIPEPTAAALALVGVLAAARKRS